MEGGKEELRLHTDELVMEDPVLDQPANGGKNNAREEERKAKRVASLDIFRGLTVALMILVDDAGGEWPAIGHAPWNGCNLADFVMPFFLFIVGMAVPLSFKRIRRKVSALRRAGLRTLKLLFWGILLQGGYSHAPDKLSYGVDMRFVRWCGILQRIALAYLVVALLEIFTKDKEESTDPNQLPPDRFYVFRLYYLQWLMGACVLLLYMAVLYGVYVPDWDFTVHNRDYPDYGKSFHVALIYFEICVYITVLVDYTFLGSS